MSASPTSREDQDSLLTFLRELPVLLLVAFVLAFLLRTFVVQVFYVPSGSMIPTLEIQDRIVVEKITYLFREPRRGEVIVFADDDPAVQPQGPGGLSGVMTGVGQFLGVVPMDARDLVKRVVGLPGDTVEIVDGTLVVNGTELDEPFVVDPDPGSYGPFEVPEGELFVLGDNRNNSGDSRFGLGYIDLDDVVGRTFVILWPLDRFGGLGTGGLDEADIPVQEPSPPSEQPDEQALAPAA